MFSEYKIVGMSTIFRVWQVLHLFFILVNFKKALSVKQLAKGTVKYIFKQVNIQGNISSSDWLPWCKLTAQSNDFRISVGSKER